MALFTLLTGRLLDAVANKEYVMGRSVRHSIGLNTEADDVLMAVCNTLISLFNRLCVHLLSLTLSSALFLDPDHSFFTSLLATLTALITTDGVALETGAGNKYNTNRPKGKLNSTQVRSRCWLERSACCCSCCRRCTTR